jgi:NADPH-dependent 2,4-dienoyl-CoA reductase/sulfur reductase-like enzyme
MSGIILSINKETMSLGMPWEKEYGYAQAVKVGDTIYVSGQVAHDDNGKIVGKTGLTSEEALRNGFEPIEDVIEDITRASYYPDNKPIWIKVVADRKNGRVLGSQIVGGEGVKERIDLISIALLLKADVTDLASYDTCYVPPASPVWEPINIAASQIAKKL